MGIGRGYRQHPHAEVTGDVAVNPEAWLPTPVEANQSPSVKFFRDMRYVKNTICGSLL